MLKLKTIGRALLASLALAAVVAVATPGTASTAQAASKTKTVYTKVTYKKVYKKFIKYTINSDQTVSLKMSNSTKKKVKWTSSDETVATVKSTGRSSAKVTPQSNGSCKIIGKVNGKKYVAYITVSNSDKKLSLTLSKIPKNQVYVGDAFTLKAKVTAPDKSTSKAVTWKSSNTSVAKVSSSGKVTCLAAGKATITCTSKANSELTASAKIKVGKDKPVYIKKLTLSGPTKAIVGEDIKYVCAVAPAKATNKELTWKSSDSSIAEIKYSGQNASGHATATITCKKEGKVNFTVYTNDGTNAKLTSKTLTIGADTSTKLSIKNYNGKIPSPLVYDAENPENCSSFQLKATVKNTTGDDSVFWYTEGDDVLSIDDEYSNTPTFTCISEGKVTLYCRPLSNSKLLWSKKITVSENTNLIKRIEIQGPSYGNPGSTITFKVTSIKPEDAANQHLEWSVSDKSLGEIVSSDDKSATVKLLKETSSKEPLILYCETTDGSNIKWSREIDITNDIYPKKLTMTHIPTEGEDHVVTAHVGESFTIETEMEPLNVTDPTLVWSSSDESKAKVDQNGKVTVLSKTQGDTFTITVKSKMTSNLSYSQEFVVCAKKHVKSITMTGGWAKEDDPQVGDETDLYFNVTPANANATNPLYTLSCDHPEYVQVTENYAKRSAHLKIIAKPASGTTKVTIKATSVENSDIWVSYTVYVN